MTSIRIRSWSGRPNGSAIATVLTLVGAVTLSACKSDSTSDATSSASSTGAAGSTVSTGGAMAGTGGAGGTAGGAATARFAARFDLSKAELPEGLVIGNGVPYVGLAVTSEIAKVNLSDGTLATFATLPKPAPNTGFMTGLAFSAKDPGVLYAALVSFAPEVQPGIYRVGASGGAASLFAKDAGMVFPNGLFADDAGNWFVADSAAGAVFRIAASGQTVEKWATDDLLLGDKDHSCASAKGAGLPFNIGANGIVKSGDAFYVSNTDKGLVARIPVGSDGKAGKVTAFAGPDCDKLGGADGVTIRGTDLYVAANFLNQIVRVGSASDVTVVASGEPLDFPASLAFEGAALYASNFAFLNAQAMKGSPGLIRIDLPASH